MNLAEIEALAKAATPGLWNWHYSDGSIVIDGPASDEVATIHVGIDNQPAEHKARFISAANPETILTLIALVWEMGRLLDTAHWREQHGCTEAPELYEEALAKYEGVTK